MDPQAALDIINNEIRRGHFGADLQDATLALGDWLDRGGFVPEVGRLHLGALLHCVRQAIRYQEGLNP